MYEHEQAAAGTETRKELTVLIVDDDQHILNAIRRALKGIGTEVLTSTDPVAIAERVVGWPDLAVVISDCQMFADIDGYDLLRRVKEVQPYTTRIMMSGTHRPIDGVSHYFIAKPFDQKEIKQTIEMGIEDYLFRVAQAMQK